MTPVAEAKANPNATPESGSANGGKTQGTGSKTSTAPAAQNGAPLTFGATAGMPRRFKGNFDFQFVRTMGCTTYDGAEIGECYETASRIEDEKEDSYTEAWRVTAERVEAIARKSLAGGHLVSAREAFLRASSYWREVGFYQCTTDPKCRAGWERQRDCFMQAGKLMDPPFEVVRIPYENGKSLPGYFLKANASNKPRPTLMSLGGADSLGEELYFWGGGAAALRRGYNALLFEIPGQRGAIYSNPGAELFFRPDTEVPLKYVCDWVLARADVDPKRLALVGWSLGGYFAPRAAAFEKRIKACIASTTLPNWQNVVLGAIGLPADQPCPSDLESKIDLSTVGSRFITQGDIRYRHGAGGGTIAAFIDGLSKYNLRGLEDKLTCPYFNIGGQGEGQLAVYGQKFYDKLTCPKAQHIITAKEGGEAHCGVNNESLEHQIIFDWLDDVSK
ncbi:MAG: alpha/beta hydrolase family protein [Candidatus Korobacteraceae bacterium]